MRSIRFVGALTAAAILAVALAVSATAAPKQEQFTIVEIAAGNKSFSTLVSLVEAAGLVKPLSGTKQLTVFAPTNAAFKSLEKQVPGVTAALTDPENKKLLRQAPLYHVVAGEVKSGAASKAAKANAKVPTLLGKNANGRLSLALKGGKIRIADSAGFNVATVVTADVDASNGVIHVINKVVVPKSIATALQKAGLL